MLVLHGVLLFSTELLKMVIFFQVNMTFKEKTVRPGDKIEMTLTASPGSLCSASMADKSVYLHGGLNLLQTSDIDNRLQEYDLTSDFINDWQYCSILSELPPDTTFPGKYSKAFMY